MNADQFKRIRLSARLTQRAAATLVSTTERTVSEWESGRVNIPQCEAELFEIKVQKLVGNKEELK